MVIIKMFKLKKLSNIFSLPFTRKVKYFLDEFNVNPISDQPMLENNNFKSVWEPSLKQWIIVCSVKLTV